MVEFIMTKLNQWMEVYCVFYLIISLTYAYTPARISANSDISVTV